MHLTGWMKFRVTLRQQHKVATRTLCVHSLPPAAPNVVLRKGLEVFGSLIDATTELLRSSVHCLGIFPNGFHRPQACSFPSPPSLICYSFCSFGFCSFSLYFFCFYSLITVPTQRGPPPLPPAPPMSQEKQGDATMWLCWQWQEWPRWQGHLSEDWDIGGRRVQGRRRRSRKDWENEKGVGKMNAESPGSTLFLFLYSPRMGRNLQFPGWFSERKVEWGDGRGGGLNHRAQHANKREIFNKSRIPISSLASVM